MIGCIQTTPVTRCWPTWWFGCCRKQQSALPSDQLSMRMCCWLRMHCLHPCMRIIQCQQVQCACRVKQSSLLWLHLTDLAGWLRASLLRTHARRWAMQALNLERALRFRSARSEVTLIQTLWWLYSWHTCDPMSTWVLGVPGASLAACVQLSSLMATNRCASPRSTWWAYMRLNMPTAPFKLSSPIRPAPASTRSRSAAL
mmetsp:Transcript_14450/g.42119  ORF Transcript_14450/g.42119 Transcript_14450/m.42119 type:complete len:200 (-) Transcript_14450:551-1150(-)